MCVTFAFLKPIYEAIFSSLVIKHSKQNDNRVSKLFVFSRYNNLFSKKLVLIFYVLYFTHAVNFDIIAKNLVNYGKDFFFYFQKWSI